MSRAIPEHLRLRLTLLLNSDSIDSKFLSMKKDGSIKNTGGPAVNLKEALAVANSGPLTPIFVQYAESKFGLTLSEGIKRSASEFPPDLVEVLKQARSYPNALAIVDSTILPNTYRTINSLVASGNEKDANTIIQSRLASGVAAPVGDDLAYETAIAQYVKVDDAAKAKAMEATQTALTTGVPINPLNETIQAFTSMSPQVAPTGPEQSAIGQTAIDPEHFQSEMMKQVYGDEGSDEGSYDTFAGGHELGSDSIVLVAGEMYKKFRTKNPTAEDMESFQQAFLKIEDVMKRFTGEEGVTTEELTESHIEYEIIEDLLRKYDSTEPRLAFNDFLNRITSERNAREMNSQESAQLAQSMGRPRGPEHVKYVPAQTQIGISYDVPDPSISPSQLDVGSESVPILNIPISESSGSRQFYSPEGTPETETGEPQQVQTQSNNYSGTTGFATQSPKGAKYHREAITVFFDSSEVPKWDYDLEANIRKAGYSKDRALTIMKGIVFTEGHNILVDEVVTDGDTEELIEILELHFSYNRNMSRGPRIPTVGISLGELLGNRGMVALREQPQTQQTPENPPTGHQEENVPSSERVQAPASEPALVAPDLAEAYYNRKYGGSGANGAKGPIQNIWTDRVREMFINSTMVEPNVGPGLVIPPYRGKVVFPVDIEVGPCHFVN